MKGDEYILSETNRMFLNKMVSNFCRKLSEHDKWKKTLHYKGLKTHFKVEMAIPNKILFWHGLSVIPHCDFEFYRWKALDSTKRLIVTPQTQYETSSW